MVSPSNKPPHKMTYRLLGNSGLLVSRFALGCAAMEYGEEDKGAAKFYELMKIAFEHGVNTLDTAENYGDGQCERNVGHAIRRGIEDGIWTREDLVVNTKVFLGSFMGAQQFTDGTPNSQGMSRKHLVEGVKASLKRLQLDYVDVLLVHRSETFTPIEETVRAMNFIIDQGWTFYWGTSMWSAAEIREACEIADRLGLVRPIVEEPVYNLFQRSVVEFEFAELYDKYKLGLTPYSPLLGGLLTGKYSGGAPDDSRYADAWMRETFVSDIDVKIAQVDKLKAVATKLGCTVAQLAIAWCASNENVSAVLLGARRPSQLVETLKAIEFVDKLTPEVKAEIDAIVPFVPQLPKKDQFGQVRARFL